MMARRNPFIPIAEAALAEALRGEQPITPRALHETMVGDVQFYASMVRAFDTEQGITALRVAAVGHVLNEYGEAIGTGRDAEHVSEHSVETIARRMAMLEQQKAHLEESLARVRGEAAQMRLADDLERLTGAAHGPVEGTR
jgi:DNA-binding transcriptional MerR regulator